MIETRLRSASYATLLQAVDAAAVGILATNRNGEIMTINRQAALVLQIDRQKAMGMTVYELLPKTGAVVRDCLESEAPRIGRQIENDERRLIVDASPICEGNLLKGVVCCIKDRNEFEQAAFQLESYKQLSKQFETIFNSSSDGIWVLDGQGTILNINKAAEKLVGAPAEQIIGKRIDTLVEKGLMDRAVTPEVLSSRLQVNLLQYVPATEKYILATGTPVFDEHGDISLVVVNERDMTRLNALVEQLHETRQRSNQYREKLAELSLLELQSDALVAESVSMRQVLKTALKLAQMEVANILIQGESGTGKGLVAKFIHQQARDSKRSFIAINCAALPENLLEAELFGYEKGAFTGAHQKGKAGLFELAQGGTLFLDEIGDIPYAVQAKLLKCLEDHEIMHLGGLKPIQIDCMVIAATNQNLEARVRQGMFRKDLYYRLNAFSIYIPALKDRPEDIFELAGFFLNKYNRDFNVRKKLSYRAMEAMEAHDFPGNVRELKNLIKKAVVMSETEKIDAIVLQELRQAFPAADDSLLNRSRFAGNLSDQLQHLEKKILQTALARHGSTRKIARHLGISQPSVVRKLKKHGLNKH